MEAITAAELEKSKPRGSLSIPLPCWMEWREKCAAALCAAEARTQLESFVAAHFNRLARKYLHRTNAKGPLQTVPAEECMHRLETSMIVKRGGREKTYKDWLFARAQGDGAIQALESGAVLLIRDVAREFLRREHSPAFMVSLCDPVYEGHAAGLTIEDLLPGASDPSNEAAARELEQMAFAHAEQVAGELDVRERVALVAREMGLSLAHPAVEKAAGCRKSALHEVHKRLYERVAHGLKKKHAQEDALAVKQLTIQALGALSALVASRARSDMACQLLFSAAEES